MQSVLRLNVVLLLLALVVISSNNALGCCRYRFVPTILRVNSIGMAHLLWHMQEQRKITAEKLEEAMLARQELLSEVRSGWVSMRPLALHAAFAAHCAHAKKKQIDSVCIHMQRTCSATRCSCSHAHRCGCLQAKIKDIQQSKALAAQLGHSRTTVTLKEAEIGKLKSEMAAAKAGWGRKLTHLQAQLEHSQSTVDKLKTELTAAKEERVRSMCTGRCNGVCGRSSRVHVSVRQADVMPHCDRAHVLSSSAIIGSRACRQT